MHRPKPDILLDAWVSKISRFGRWLIAQKSIGSDTSDYGGICERSDTAMSIIIISILLTIMKFDELFSVQPMSDIVHSVPNEIWLEIFSWLVSLDHHTWKYSPFQVLSASGTPALGQMRSILPLVCRKWKELVADLLYHDVVIGRSQETLKFALETRGRSSLVCSLSSGKKPLTDIRFVVSNCLTLQLALQALVPSFRSKY